MGGEVDRKGAGEVVAAAVDGAEPEPRASWTSLLGADTLMRLADRVHVVDGAGEPVETALGSGRLPRCPGGPSVGDRRTGCRPGRGTGAEAGNPRGQRWLQQAVCLHAQGLGAWLVTPQVEDADDQAGLGVQQRPAAVTGLELSDGVFVYTEIQVKHRLAPRPEPPHDRVTIPHQAGYQAAYEGLLLLLHPAETGTAKGSVLLCRSGGQGQRLAVETVHLQHR
jgi:hypothetical protein